MTFYSTWIMAGAGFFYIFYFIAVTAVFLLIGGAVLLYFLMGLGQWVTGFREKDPFKKRKGSITAIITLLVLLGATYFYLRLCFWN